MADTTTVVEGKIKFRDGKKWKPRWCVLKKPSPVADRLQVILYKDLTEYTKNEIKPKSVFALDAFFGLDAGFTYDRELHVLAIICYKNTSLMAFELRENMIQFEIKIRQSMGEEHQFPVKVVKAPSSSKIPKDPVRMIIHDMRFCLIAQTPPKIILSWNVEDLRRFGATEGKFCFEGGTRCGKGSGIFAFQSEQAEDIAHIVNLASTGKMANCHRKFKNRSSQIDFNSHLNADLSSSPSSSSIHHPHHPDAAARTSPQGALPVTLNCCHDNQTGSAESEDWSWYKRHSVGVMDHHRIDSFKEGGFLDNREHLVMGIYDVPPNHGKRLDNNIWKSLDEPNYAHPRPDTEGAQRVSQFITSSHSKEASGLGMPPCVDYGNYKRIVPREREYVNSVSDEQRQAICQKRQSASAELLDSKVNCLDDMLSRHEQKDSLYTNSHEESLQCLKKQESDLQREMVLLDEILQNCAPRNPEVPFEDNHLEMDNNAKHIHEPVIKQGPQQEPSHPLTSMLDHNFVILSGNVSSLKLTKSELSQNTHPKKLDRATILRLNTSLPEGTPSSPLFYAKLCNLPPSSRLNAPLPYVNLSKYDDESNSHVHLPGSADSVPVARISSMQMLHDGNHGLKGRNLSLTSLHNSCAVSSLNNINQSVPSRNHSFKQKSDNSSVNLVPCSITDANQWDNNNSSHHDEILVVNMDSQPQYPRHIGHTAQKSAMHDNDTTTAKSNTDIVNILTTDAKRPMREERLVNKAEIYENLPIRKNNTPPPELPPKGPDLLKKLKATTTSNNKFFGSHNLFIDLKHKNHSEKNTESNNYGYDNHPRQVVNDKESQSSADFKEDNYLIMGSPKIKHKDTLAKPLSNLEFSPQRSHCVSSGSTSGDYLGMGKIGTYGVNSFNEDEIYLDVDTVCQELRVQDLYISEADLKPPRTKNNSTVLVESTYMEMGKVSIMKNFMLKQAEAPEQLLSQIKSGQYVSSSASIVSPKPTPVPPPRPVSLKVRHNSDSGVPVRSGEQTVIDEHISKAFALAKPVKSPTRVYTKVKKINEQSQVSEAPMPFPNLIEFSKKLSDSRSTYVNTYMDADKNLVPQEIFVSRDVPLPEPVKEGFLARFKRRSSKEKNAYQTQEKSANSKNRNSVLERSISEHESTKVSKEDKAKLKVGRRRSSSFPNQLTYQEFIDSSETPITKQATSSSSSFSSGSSKPKPEQSESSSSVRDFSDDSDMSPLLKRGDKKTDQQTLTVLHVQRSDHTPVNPYLTIYKSPTKINNLSNESSKTDDEKLIEIIQRKNETKKPIVYQRTSSLDLKKPDQEPEQEYLKPPQIQHKKDRRFSFDKLIGCSTLIDSDIPSPKEPARSLDSINNPHSEQSKFSFHNSFSDQSNVASASSLCFSLDVEPIPPSLPPKTRPYQGLLSPVIEIAPPIPTLSEPIYVDMDEFLSSSDVERARRKKDILYTNLCVSPAPMQDENNSRPLEVETKAGIFTF